MVGDAEELPFDDDQFDIYTIAFGIRNVTHIDQVTDPTTTAAFLSCTDFPVSGICEKWCHIFAKSKVMSLNCPKSTDAEFTMTLNMQILTFKKL